MDYNIQACLMKAYSFSKGKPHDHPVRVFPGVGAHALYSFDMGRASTTFSQNPEAGPLESLHNMFPAKGCCEEISALNPQPEIFDSQT